MSGGRWRLRRLEIIECSRFYKRNTFHYENTMLCGCVLVEPCYTHADWVIKTPRPSEAGGIRGGRKALDG